MKQLEYKETQNVPNVLQLLYGNAVIPNQMCPISRSLSLQQNNAE